MKEKFSFKLFRYTMMGFLVLMLFVGIYTNYSDKAQAQSNPQGQTCVLAMYPTGNNGSQIVCTASTTLALSTGAVSPGACDAAQSVALSGVTTSSTIDSSFASNPVGVTGYGSGNNGITLRIYPTAGSANVLQCNYGSGSITPGAMTINLRANP